MHPESEAVALCDACGRPACLACAVPVRGQVFGRECLADVLGPDQEAAPDHQPGAPRDPALLAAGLGFVAVVVASILPWTRFGQGAGTFGAWGFSPARWSLLSAIAGAVGFLAWLVIRIRPSRARSGTLLLWILAASTAAGAVMHMWHPPGFTHPWLGPWVALGGAAVVVGATGWRRLRRSVTPVP
jgi:hypothetical protein